MQKSWYLLCYRYGHAERAIKNLERLGVQCFSPRTKKITPSGKRKTGDCSEKEHMFPPYIFVEFNPEDILISSVQCTPGVNGFVRFGHEIKPISNVIMNDLLKVNNEANAEVNTVISKIIHYPDKQQRAIMFLNLMEKVMSGEGITLNHFNG